MPLLAARPAGPPQRLPVCQRSPAVPPTLAPTLPPTSSLQHPERRSTQIRPRASCRWCSRASPPPCAAPSGRPLVRPRHAGQAGAGWLRREPSPFRLQAGCQQLDSQYSAVRPPWAGGLNTRRRLLPLLPAPGITCHAPALQAAPLPAPASPPWRPRVWRCPACLTSWCEGACELRQGTQQPALTVPGRVAGS